MPEHDHDWVNIRCPNCNRWLGKVTSNWKVGVKLGLFCTNCKREYIYPADQPEMTRDRRSEKGDE